MQSLNNVSDESLLKELIKRNGYKKERNTEVKKTSFFTSKVIYGLKSHAVFIHFGRDDKKALKV